MIPSDKRSSSSQKDHDSANRRYDTLANVMIFIALLPLNVVFTVLRNALICLAFYWNRRLRTLTNICVLSLPTGDITTISLNFPVGCISAGFEEWPFNFHFCQFLGFVVSFWAKISVNILALTAVNRFFCIVKPHLYSVLFSRRKTILSIIFVVSLTFLAFLAATLAIPILFEWNQFYLLCSPSGNELNNKFSSFITGLLALTMFSIFLCYGAVYHAIRRHNSVVIPSL